MSLNIWWELDNLVSRPLLYITGASPGYYQLLPSTHIQYSGQRKTQQKLEEFWQEKVPQRNSILSARPDTHTTLPSHITLHKMVSQNFQKNHSISQLHNVYTASLRGTWEDCFYLILIRSLLQNEVRPTSTTLNGLDEGYFIYQLCYEDWYENITLMSIFNNLEILGKYLAIFISYIVIGIMLIY